MLQFTVYLSPVHLNARANVSFFFFNDTATTEIYTLSLHDALPISVVAVRARLLRARRRARRPLRPRHVRAHRVLRVSQVRLSLGPRRAPAVRLRRDETPDPDVSQGRSHPPRGSLPAQLRVAGAVRGPARRAGAVGIPHDLVRDRKSVV